MAKIFYGNGEAEIQGEDIIYCELKVKYPIEIDDTSPEDFHIIAKNNKIIVAKYPSNNNKSLKKMFNYVGELNILKAVVIDGNGNKEYPLVKRVMDYTELLATKSEDMTTLSENLKSTYIHGRKIKKMKVLQSYIENLTIKGNNFYLEDGSNYKGSFHIRKEDGNHFTGNIHDENSLPLYFKDIFQGDVKEELILFSHNNYKKTRNWKTFGQGRDIRKIKKKHK